MANYLLSHTGAQIDAGIDAALNIENTIAARIGTHTGAEIDASVTFTEGLTSTNTQIDASVGVTEALVAGTLYASQAEAEAGTSESVIMNPLRTKQAIDALASAVEPGSIAYKAVSSAPTGWLKANGAAVSRTTYAALFAAIGTTFGAGNGSTTFNLPDLRGEFVRGWDDGRGVDSGRAFGSSQAATEILSGAIAANLNPLNIPYNNADGLGAGGQNRYVVPDNSPIPSNSGQFFRVRPRNIALLACIKY